MSDRAQHDADLARLREENRQLRAALEASGDERDRLQHRLAAQARDLLDARWRHDAADGRPLAEVAELYGDVAEEELRVAFEELQVLTEELEVTNSGLQEANRDLDRKVAERTRELERNIAALARTEASFRTLVEGIPQLVWRAGAGGRWTFSSRQWSAYTHLSADDSLGFGWLGALHPEDRVVAEAAWLRADRGAVLEFEARIFHAGERRYRHFRTRAIAMRDEAGALVDWLGTSTDVDDLMTLQGQQSVLVGELQHRTRNLIGVVRSIGTQTLSSARDLDDFAARFGDRLDALSRVQGVLSRAGTEPTTLRELIAMELDALGAAASDRVTLRGPAIALRPSAVQTLALGLHELATNALKYGALASPHGRLAIAWETRDDRLVLTWVEEGILASSTPRRNDGSGYGRTLIEKALPYALGAVTSIEIGAAAVRCVIDLPLARFDTLAVAG